MNKPGFHTLQCEGIRANGHQCKRKIVERHYDDECCTEYGTIWYCWQHRDQGDEDCDEGDYELYGWGEDQISPDSSMARN